MAMLTFSAALPAEASGVEITKPGEAAETVQKALQQPVKQVNFENMLLADKLPAASNPPEAETLKIDLKGAVSTAIQNNRDIRISEYALTEAEASVSEAAAAKTRVWPIHFQQAVPRAAAEPVEESHLFRNLLGTG